MWRFDECVNFTDIKGNSSACRHIESKGSVERSDVDASVMKAGVPGFRAVAFSNSDARMIAGDHDVELDLSQHVCAGMEDEGIGVNSVDIVSGAETSTPMPEVRAYEVGAEELFNTFQLRAS